MIISLIGFMGCGKSSVGRRLSELLCCRFVDLDEVVEEVAGKRVGEIFAVEGEVAFRDLELLSLNNILSKTSFQPTSNTAVGTAAEETEMVLALGGGTVMNSECAEMVKEKTLCVYLRASVNTLAERMANETAQRPLLSDINNQPGGDCLLRKRIEELLCQRAATYENTAHIIIDTDGKSIDQICSEIMQ